MKIIKLSKGSTDRPVHCSCFASVTLRLDTLKMYWKWRSNCQKRRTIVIITVISIKPQQLPWNWTVTYHCPLSYMQACISSSCSPVSLVRVSMKVPVRRPLPLLPLSGTHSTRLEAASSGCLAQWPATFSLLVHILVEIFGRSLQLIFSAFLSILV